MTLPPYLCPYLSPRRIQHQRDHRTHQHKNRGEPDIVLDAMTFYEEFHKGEEDHLLREKFYEMFFIRDPADCLKYGMLPAVLTTSLKEYDEKTA